MSRREFSKWVQDWKVIFSALGVCVTIGAYGQSLKTDIAEAKAKADKVDRIERMLQRVGDKMGVTFDDIR